MAEVDVEVFEDGQKTVDSHHHLNVLQEAEIAASISNLQGSCGKNLHCKYWKPVQEPTALVVLVHGLAEHLEWYDELGKKLAEEGLYAFGHDHVGHGRSEGHRVHIDSVDEYVDDVLLHVKQMKEQYPKLDVFAVGHSMGGMITLKAALTSPSSFKGVVLMGPLIYIDPNIVSPFRIMVAKVLSKVVPHLSVGGLDLVHVTRDVEMKERMLADPLRWQGGVKSKWAVAVHQALVDINAQLDKMSVPFLIIHGEKDKLCNVEGSRALFEKAPVADKQFKEFKEAHHHLYLEPLDVRQEALKDTIDWLVARATKPEKQ